ATALADRTHERIGQAIGDQILAMQDRVNALVDYVHNVYLRDDLHRDKIAKLEAEERRFDQQRSRLVRLAMSTDNPPASIVEELRTIERQLDRSRGELQDLREQAIDQAPEVTRERILDVLQRTVGQLIANEREVGPLLERLIPDKIRAVP